MSSEMIKLGWLKSVVSFPCYKLFYGNSPSHYLSWKAKTSLIKLDMGKNHCNAAYVEAATELTPIKSEGFSHVRGYSRALRLLTKI